MFFTSNITLITATAVAVVSAGRFVYLAFYEQSTKEERLSDNYDKSERSFSQDNSNKPGAERELELKIPEAKPKIIYPKLLSINYNEGKSEQNNFEIEVNYNLKKYFETLNKFIEGAQESIYVLDYVEHGKELNKSAAFFSEVKKNYEDYFSNLENTVKNNKNIEYIRVLQLPVNTNTILDSNSPESVLKYALDNLYSPTRKHIDSLIGEPNFKLFIIACAVRLHSEVVIDKSAWLIEIDNYDKEKQATPDCLFISTAEESFDIGLAIENEHKKITAIIHKHKAYSKQDLTNVILKIREKNDILVEDFNEILNENN